MTLTYEPLAAPLSDDVLTVLSGYPYKRFQHTFQGISQAGLARFHLAGLERQAAGDGVLLLVRDAGRPVGVMGASPHPRHSEAFGHNIWIANPLVFLYLEHDRIAHALRELAGQAHDAGAQLLSGRVDVEDHAAVAAAEAAGWRSVGTSVKLALQAGAVPGEWRNLIESTQSDVTIRPLDPAETSHVQTLGAIARASHTHSHFFNDPRLCRDAALDLFADWARRCTQFSHAQTLVAEAAGQCLGFVTLLVNQSIAQYTGKSAGVIDFIAVAPEAQGRGIGGRLVRAALAALAERVDLIEVRTMLDNYAAIGLYQRCGAVLTSADTQLHGWHTA